MSDPIPFKKPEQPSRGMPFRDEPTVQLCLNDAELGALKDLLSSIPIVQNITLMPVLLDIENGDYITLDTD